MTAHAPSPAEVGRGLPATRPVTGFAEAGRPVAKAAGPVGSGPGAVRGRRPRHARPARRTQPPSRVAKDAP